MQKAQLISNSTKGNHLKYILECFKDADEVWMATAFLKSSGLTLLLPSISKHIRSDKPITIVTGQHFALTEPKALYTLHHLFEKKINALLYLDKAEIKSQVFHPKLFVFRYGKKALIISGSANITSGGLTSNNEFSICIETETFSVQWKEVNQYFGDITDVVNANLASLAIIKLYEKFYKDQKQLKEKQKSIPDKMVSEHTFSINNLKVRIKVYRKDKTYLEELNNRIKDYNEAKKILNEMAVTSKLGQKRFEELIDMLVGRSGQASLWKSGSLNRLRHDVYKCKNEFQELVRIIKDNQQLPASKVFNWAKEQVKKVDGARMNYVAEILMTFQPDRFANLNLNPITVLKKETGVYFKAHSSSFNGEDYENYCVIISKMAKELSLRNMLEVDTFFNFVYRKLMEEEKEAKLLFNQSGK
ncbi:MAG: phospholipase D-like domain-containing protein [Bacteroidota bacterium]